ncbi:hypothetical protein [Methylobacterium aerolatum]|uniref:Uncharacterized protein n=1 Tax=Methylobacterium aerolatum TaxID=418708 RepID=A0ABU0I1S0_9HYPH|nr:hypothetical protein [Methylobacterium aerolatum]MDQ0448546.1 hypothetical protein [Methylobacterium aerolatum]GJD33163.1 hypothetical protein FMGBMHLM_0048 [Methylobacterium aerolatum]
MNASRTATGLLAAALLVTAACPAEARPRHPRHAGTATDSERGLARMALRDRSALWPAWEDGRPPESRLAPATRERVAAPPFTGWGYGGTVPGAWPGF